MLVKKEGIERSIILLHAQTALSLGANILFMSYSRKGKNIRTASKNLNLGRVKRHITIASFTNWIPICEITEQDLVTSRVYITNHTSTRTTHEFLNFNILIRKCSFMAEVLHLNWKVASLNPAGSIQTNVQPALPTQTRHETHNNFRVKHQIKHKN